MILFLLPQRDMTTKKLNMAQEEVKVSVKPAVLTYFLMVESATIFHLMLQTKCDTCLQKQQQFEALLDLAV